MPSALEIGAVGGVSYSMLLTVPNISEGRDRALVEQIASQWRGLTLFDLHLDPDHGRSVLSLGGPQGVLSDGAIAGAGATYARLDLDRHDGLHPHVGVLDVCPVVYPEPSQRGAACAEALVIANAIANDYGVPVFLYGDLADSRERAQIRLGGPAELAHRMRAGELTPDFGPGEPHPTAGATLVTARPPLVAFNLELEHGSLDQARAIAAAMRESGGGLTGVRAIGLWLEMRNRAQVSFNVHDPFLVPLRTVVEGVAAYAPVAAAEIVGLVPRAALDAFPDDLPILGFEPHRQVLEDVLESARRSHSGR